MSIQILPILAAFGGGIALVVVSLFTSGYNPIPPTPSPVPTVHDYQNSIVALTRMPCYGYCPDYFLTVYGNGTVLYEGHRFVKTRGNYTYAIPTENVSKLVDEFYFADFFSMPSRYDGCIDCPVNIVSITVDGKTKSVNYSVDFPEKLKTLDKRIDELSGSLQYVRCIPKGYCEK